MRMRYTLLLNEEGGILDDLMVDAARATVSFWSSMRRARRPISRICATRLGSAATSSSSPTGRCWRCRARRRGRPGALRRRHRAAAVHDARRSRDRRRDTASSPAPAIPARTVSRFRCRRMRPRLSRACCWPSRRYCRSASAPAIRCASKPGSASTGMTSTRPRPRSRPASPGRSASAGGRKAAFPAPRVILRQLAEGAARKRVGIRPDGRAPAREGTPIVDNDGATSGG